ncbi:MAG: AAA family ATPase [Sphaerochaeta sp.]|jgi:phage shock protein A
MIVVYVASVLLMLFVIGICIVSIRLYSKALSLNPMNRTLDQILNEIEKGQLTKEGLLRELEHLQSEKTSALETIAKKKDAEEFLNTHEAELQRKKQHMAQVDDELSALAKKYSEREEEYRALSENYSELVGKTEEKTIELQSVSAQLEARRKEMQEVKDSIALLEERKESLEKERSELLSRIEELKRLAKELEDKNKELESVRQGIAESYRQLGDLKKQISEAKLEEAEYQGKTAAAEHRWADLDRVYFENRHIKKESINENGWLEKFKGTLQANNIKFDDRTINAFHTGLKVSESSPLVVLAGISGTGKSLLPQLYATAMGLNFLTVAVQPRWDSPQDMFGFYNYMQNKFKATELSRALWQFDIYNNELTKRQFESEDSLPVNLVLLDEMNLARVEYYFSDMLSKLEVRRSVDPHNDTLRRTAEIELECGSLLTKDVSRRLYVGANTLFVGTMNEDETTQSLSDKVMDRSNVLRFGRPPKLTSKPDILNFTRQYDTGSYLSYKQWKTMESRERLTSEQRKHLKDDIIENINRILAKVGRPFAHRVWLSIEHYVESYPNVTADASFRSAVADQIEMKVLPKLNGLDKSSAVARNAFDEILDLLEREVRDEALLSAFKTVRDDASIFFSWKGVER